MPYRKYKNPKQGKYGPIYRIDSGITVSKNHDGNWLINLNKGGKRKNRTIGPGKDNLIIAIKAAEQIASKLKNKAIVAVQDDEAKSTIPRFADYSKIWLKLNEKRWSDTTWERYEGMLRNHIWPNKTFSSKRLDKITRADVKRVLQNHYATHSASSVEIAHTVIHSVFEEAIDDQIIVAANPARQTLKKILPPKHKRNEDDPHPLTKEEASLFLDHASKLHDKPKQLLFKVMLWGGLRLGEALAMRTGFLDFNKKAYYVTNSYKRKKFRDPKNGKPRWVDFPDYLLQELRQHITFLKEQSLKKGQPGDIDLLFIDPKENGNLPFSQEKIRRAVAKVCFKSGLYKRTPHDLRHTYATWLLMDHISPAYVKKQLGHSSIRTTVDTYGHWIPGEGRDGLEDALKPVRNPDEECIFLHIEKKKARN